jgi:hypothetical protein
LPKAPPLESLRRKPVPRSNIAATLQRCGFQSLEKIAMMPPGTISFATAMANPEPLTSLAER